MRLFTDLDQPGLFHTPAALQMEVSDRRTDKIPHYKNAVHWMYTSDSMWQVWYRLQLQVDIFFVRFPGSWPFRPRLLPPGKHHQTLPALPFRLIRSNLKSKIPDSTFSDGIACMFCMAVWIKDWLSLLLSCSNLCPLSLHTGSSEFPKQSGLTFPGRYRLRHVNKLKCKAKENIKSDWKRQSISTVIKFVEKKRGDARWRVRTYSRGIEKDRKINPHSYKTLLSAVLWWHLFQCKPIIKCNKNLKRI